MRVMYMYLSGARLIQVRVLTRTRPLALGLRDEVVLIAPFTVVLERNALSVVGVVVPALNTGVSGTRSQRHRAGIRG